MEEKPIIESLVLDESNTVYISSVWVPPSATTVEEEMDNLKISSECENQRREDALSIKTDDNKTENFSGRAAPTSENNDHEL
uniref:Uncharacterized protein n=1 Tax=Panagrellus redivivus TaxID=6233 RepID=A0A7E4UWI5_PANRE